MWSFTVWPSRRRSQTPPPPGAPWSPSSRLTSVRWVLSAPTLSWGMTPFKNPLPTHIQSQYWGRKTKWMEVTMSGRGVTIRVFLPTFFGSGLTIRCTFNFGTYRKTKQRTPQKLTTLTPSLHCREVVQRWQLQTNVLFFSVIVFKFGIGILWNLFLIAIFHSWAYVFLTQCKSCLNIGDINAFTLKWLSLPSLALLLWV